MAEDADFIVDEEELMGEEEEVEAVNDPDKPMYPALTLSSENREVEEASVPVPVHRMGPLRRDWPKIYEPIVTNLKLQIRMNTRNKCIEIRTTKQTEEIGAMTKATDFVKAYLMGFEVNDALALLRLEELYIDSFEITDVKMLAGDNLSRAIGRVVGKDGKTKFTIENTTRTRLVIANTKIHILGSFNNIKVARDAVSDLILGSPPGKVYARLRTVSSRIAERF
eukprot:Phypoly_transcript_16968.p1 GENE.Phypoly_transcript_16968~~Phypoly_transcript_16968.p1  ORF type:complete len:224 (-),score=34.89 Phypoly_transcript_16968:37-708(-)